MLGWVGEHSRLKEKQRTVRGMVHLRTNRSAVMGRWARARVTGQEQEHNRVGLGSRQVQGSES